MSLFSFFLLHHYLYFARLIKCNSFYQCRDLPALAYERICKHLELDLAREQFIVIGDTPNDIDCAKHFGARSLAVGTGRLYGIEAVRACHPDALLPDFSDVELVMKTLEGL